jgi:hypothetical protein
MRGRHLLHSLGLHRHPESRAVDAHDEHRPQPGRPAVPRVVAHLRPRSIKARTSPTRPSGRIRSSARTSIRRSSCRSSTTRTSRWASSGASWT